MFAIFGLGFAEILVLFLIVVLIGVPVILFVVLPGLRQAPRTPQRHDEIADLRAEIADLRAEVERLRTGTDKKDPPDPGIKAGPAS